MSTVHDLYAERALLNAAIEGGAWDDLRDVVRAGDFYAPMHRRIWAAVASVGLSGAPMDARAVSAHLATAGAHEGAQTALANATADMASARHAETHAKRVRDLAAVRSVMTVMGELKTSADSGIDDVPKWLDDAERALMGATEGRAGTSALRHIREGVQTAYERLKARADAGGKFEGYESGLDAIDKALSGWTPGRFYILGGRPGSGKTVVSKDVVIGVARSTGKPCAVFSLEVPEEEWVSRGITSESGIDYNDWRQAKLDRRAWDALAPASNALAELPIWIDETPGVDVEYIARACRRHRQQHGDLGIVIVDHMMLMGASDKRASREQQMAWITKSFKNLAKELKVPVVGLAQLNRKCEDRTDKRPMMADIRESGAAEQDADAVIFVYRDEVYNPETPDRGVMELIIAKQRAGEVGIVKHGFEGKHMRVTNLDAHHSDSDGPPTNHTDGSWGGY